MVTLLSALPRIVEESDAEIADDNEQSAQAEDAILQKEGTFPILTT